MSYLICLNKIFNIFAVKTLSLLFLILKNKKSSTWTKKERNKILKQSLKYFNFNFYKENI